MIVSETINTGHVPHAKYERLIARAKQVYEDIKQVPIVVRRELEGFILNRLQGALLGLQRVRPDR